MKKLTAAQQTRLDELSGRDDLSASESAELKFFQSLAETSEETDEETPEDEEPEEDETEKEEPQDSAQPGLTIFQKAEATLRSKSNLVGQVATLKAELSDARATITTLEAQVVTLTEEADEGKKLATRIAELEAEDKTVSEKAARVAANNHVSEEDLPDSTDDAVTGADHEAALAQLKGRDRSAYIREHREAIAAANMGLN